MKTASLILSCIMITVLTAFKTQAKDLPGSNPANISPTATPVNGVLKGVVEVGATGFSFFVIRVDEKKNWELVAREYGLSKAFENKTNLDSALIKLKDYINVKMFKKYKVPSKNIHFVVSSGAQRATQVQLLIMKLNKIGYVVNAVTSEEEGQYALAATLPKQYYNSGFVVDMGSSNTKITYFENGNSTATGKETVGAKYAEKNKPDDAAYKDAFSVASNVPVANRQRCYIIGGVPFELANSHRNGEEAYTTLKKPSEYDYNKIGTDDKDKIKVKSGLNIYRAIADATQCPEFVFFWDSSFSIGFLLSLK